jgi:hypothetical protein
MNKSNKLLGFMVIATIVLISCLFFTKEKAITVKKIQN